MKESRTEWPQDIAYWNREIRLCAGELLRVYRSLDEFCGTDDGRGVLTIEDGVYLIEADALEYTSAARGANPIFANEIDQHPYCLRVQESVWREVMEWLAASAGTGDGDGEVAILFTDVKRLRGNPAQILYGDVSKVFQSLKGGRQHRYPIEEG
jgi:hypothetical protein